MKRFFTGSALILAALAAVPGCDMSRDEMRPDMNQIQTQNGLQARDLQEMTSTLAPTLLSIPEIVQNPNRITVVCLGGNNHLEGEPTKDVSIYAFKMQGLLSQAVARDRITFVADRRVLDQMRASQFGNANPDPMEANRYPGMAPPDPTIRPQYALYVDVRSMRGEKTTYYLCQFQLTSFATGQIVWEGDWDTQTRVLGRHH